MTEAKFRRLLKTNRHAALSLLIKQMVSEWINDGIEEVVRCLTCWGDQKLNFGNDKLIIEMAEDCGLFDEECFCGADVGVESTCCGSMCEECRREHADECEVCRDDFAQRSI